MTIHVVSTLIVTLGAIPQMGLGNTVVLLVSRGLILLSEIDTVKFNFIASLM